MEVLAGLVVFGFKIPILVIHFFFAVFSWVVGKILDSILG